MEFTTGPMELNNMLKNKENIRIIDVRQRADYAKEHIPQAENLPKDRWESFEGLERDKVNVVYCYSEACHLAAEAAKNFAEHGFSVMELEGGFETWETNHLPTETLDEFAL